MFDDLAKETQIINEALQPFPHRRERLLFIPAFSVKGLRSAWPWAGPANSVPRSFALLHRRRRPRSGPSHPGSAGNNPQAGSRGPRTGNTPGQAPGPLPPSAVFYFFISIRGSDAPVCDTWFAACWSPHMSSAVKGWRWCTAGKGRDAQMLRQIVFFNQIAHK